MDIGYDLRMPDIVDLLNHQPSFFLSEHEPVPIVVMTRVGVVKPWGCLTFGRCPQCLPIPAIHDIDPVRID